MIKHKQGPLKPDEKWSLVGSYVQEVKKSSNLWISLLWSPVMKLTL